jgi:ketosteroid isomerase-like protein
LKSTGITLFYSAHLNAASVNFDKYFRGNFMKNTFKIFLFMTTLSGCMKTTADISEHIIGLEKAALERWNKGDVYGFLELSADDIVYFDPMIEHRMDGLEKLTEYYKPAQGMINVYRYEMINPKVQAADDMAVLTYNLKSETESDSHFWNCTEVFRKEPDGKWKIIQTHWSITKPDFKF